MTTKIKLKKSSVAGNIPDASDLDYGELAINYADGRLWYKNSSNEIKGFSDSDREIAQALDLIDSAYVQLRQDKSYGSLIGAPYIPSLGTDYVDSSTVLPVIDSRVDSAYVQLRAVGLDYNRLSNLPSAAGGLDSALVTQLIDSSYIQLRDTPQDFAYGSLTGTPTIPTFGTDFVDSAATNTLIDARVTNTFINNLSNVDADTLGGQNSAYHLNYNNFTNTPTIMDSAEVVTAANAAIDGKVNKAYIQAFDFLDSAEVVNAANAATDLKVTKAYIQGFDFLDSAEVVTAANARIDAKVDATFINALTIDADTLGGQNSAYHLNYDNFTNKPTIMDSAEVVTAANAAIDAKVTLSYGKALGFLDSAEIVQAAKDAVNKVYIQAFDFLDSGEVVTAANAAIDGKVNASYINALTIDADTLGGQNSAYHLAYANFTGTPTIPTLGTDFVDSAEAIKLVNSTIDSAQVALLLENNNINPGKVDMDSAAIGQIEFKTNWPPAAAALGNDGHIAHTEGAIWYDPYHKNLNFYTDIAHPIELGMQMVERVYNNTGSTINKGSPLYYSGNRVDTAGQESPTVGLADATDENKYNVQGLASEDIADGTYGQIVVSGVIDHFDTSGLNAGQNFFAGLSPGALQNAAPTYPNFPMCLGWVIKSHATEGKVIINQQNHSVNTFRVRGDTHLGADLQVDGDLTVLGTTTSVSTADLTAGTPMFRLNEGDAIGEAGTTFTGTGNDDAFFSGHFTGTSAQTYYVRIDGVGTGAAGVDTFEVALGADSNFASPILTKQNMTGEDQLIHSADNISVKFAATTGHDSGDRWSGTASPINVDTGFFSNRNTGTSGVGYTHVGFYFDISDTKWKFIEAYDSTPQGTINTADGSFTLATVNAATFEGALQGNVTGDLTGNAATATTATNITASANNSADETVYLTFVDGATGTQGIETDTGLTYNPSTGTITSTTFSGALSGNASTATSAATLTTARNIGGVSFDGSANIDLPGVNTAGNQNTSGTAAIATSITATANNSTDETVYLTFVDGATGTQGIETDTGLSYNPNSGIVTATAFAGDGSALTGLPASGLDSALVLQLIDSDYVNLTAGVSTTRTNFVVGTAAGSYNGSTTDFPVTYTVGLVDVYLNGIKMVVGTDVTATNGTSVVLASAADIGMTVEVVAYQSFGVANHYTQTAADSRFVNVTGDTMTGDLTVNANIITSGSISTGGNDANSAGLLNVYGGATGEGGEIRIFPSAAEDTTIDHWSIDVATDDLRMFSSTGDLAVVAVANGGTFLYHDGSEKLETVSGGVEVTGTLDATGVVTGPTTDTLLVINSSGTTVKTIRGV